MKLSRNIAIKIGNILDNWLPPVVRDSKLFVYLPFKYMFKDKANVFFTFKQKAPHISEAEYIKLYKEIDPYLIKRETSLNTSCILTIMQSVVGQKVLEVGCGNAYLAKKLSNKYSLTGVDILVDTSTRKDNGHIQFVNANAEHLPFEDKSFDTTICTHTLEHVLNFEKAISELRRVTKNRVIIVVPMQKPFKYTFDLHLRFFPFLESFLLALIGVGSPPKSFACKDLDGDIFYYEDRE